MTSRRWPPCSASRPPSVWWPSALSCRATDYTSPLGFLAILPLVWAALRRGPWGIVTAALILIGFAVWGAPCRGRAVWPSGPQRVAEALRYLEQGIGFDLVFTDIGMPDAINGLRLAEICQAQFPGIPVLLTSGYNDAAQAADGRFDILRQPFELSALERGSKASAPTPRDAAQAAAAVGRTMRLILSIV